MSLHDHAAAARILGNALITQSDTLRGSGYDSDWRCLSNMGYAYLNAAEIMENVERKAAEDFATGCTLDHRTGPQRCPACGAPKGPQ